MPVLDGLAATRRLRVIEKDRGDDRGYWVVGCTGNARTEVSLSAKRPCRCEYRCLFITLVLQQINAVLESGMNAVITKPYNLQELLRVIQPPERDTDTLNGNILSSTASVPAD